MAEAYKERIRNLIPPTNNPNKAKRDKKLRNLKKAPATFRNTFDEAISSSQIVTEEDEEVSNAVSDNRNEMDSEDSDAPPSTSETAVTNMNEMDSENSNAIPSTSANAVSNINEPSVKTVTFDSLPSTSTGATNRFPMKLMNPWKRHILFGRLETVPMNYWKN